MKRKPFMTLKPNDVEISNGLAIKTYGNALYPFLFPSQNRHNFSPYNRFNREKDLIRRLSGQGIRTLNVEGWDGNTPVLVTTEEEVVTLEDAMSLRILSPAEKLDLIEKAAKILREIHLRREYHGDAYLGNFFLTKSGELIVGDFEYTRICPDPQTLDVVLFSASALCANGYSAQEGTNRVLDLVKNIFGERRFHFGEADKMFYRYKFKLGRDFFDFFT